MTEQQSIISEIVDKILKAEPDITEDGKDYLERSRIVRIIRGLEEWTKIETNLID